MLHPSQAARSAPPGGVPQRGRLKWRGTRVLTADGNRRTVTVAGCWPASDTRRARDPRPGHAHESAVPAAGGQKGSHPDSSRPHQAEPAPVRGRSTGAYVVGARNGHVPRSAGTHRQRAASGRRRPSCLRPVVSASERPWRNRPRPVHHRAGSYGLSVPVKRRDAAHMTRVRPDGTPTVLSRAPP